MHPAIQKHTDALGELCRQFGVARLELFGSAALETDFDPDSSDADFLVSFEPGRATDLAGFADFKESLESLLGRPVDLVDREAVAASRNHIRRKRILSEAQLIYG